MRRMKKGKVLMLAGIVACTLASCLGNDDDNDQKVMTPQEYQKYMTEMSGLYDGKTYFYNIDRKVDSVVVSAEFLGIGDSTITISHFPARLLAKCVSDSVVRKAVENESDLRLKMKYYINAFNNGKLYYGVYPMSVTFEDLEYRNGLHDVTFNFVNYLNNEGLFMNNATDLNFYLLDMYEDGTQKETYYSLYDSYNTSNGYFTFVTSLKKQELIFE